MATGPGVNQGKSAFLEKFLSGHRDANLDAVNRAWNEAGHDGTISESLFGKLRSKLGLTGRKGTNGVATEEKAAPPAKGKAKSSMKGTNGNVTSKAEEAPSQTPVRDGDTGPSKSAFVGEVLGREPEANVAAINRAWASAGHEGTISDSIYYKVKRERGVTAGRTSPAPVGPKPQSASKGPEAKSAAQPTVEPGPEADGVPAPSQPAGVPRSGVREKVLDRVEDEIDDLIIVLKKLGGMEEALEAMRKVRRVVVRSHEG
jgi:hypothetical protein